MSCSCPPLAAPCTSVARARDLSRWESTHGVHVDALDTLTPAIELDSPTLYSLRSGREIAPDSPDSPLRPLRYRDRDVL